MKTFYNVLATAFATLVSLITKMTFAPFRTLSFLSTVTASTSATTSSNYGSDVTKPHNSGQIKRRLRSAVKPMFGGYSPLVRTLSAFLLVCLLVGSTPVMAIPMTTGALMNAGSEAAFELRRSDLLEGLSSGKYLSSFFSYFPSLFAPLKMADAQIARIEIYPKGDVVTGTVNAGTGSRLVFTAVGLSESGDPVLGTGAIQWKLQNTALPESRPSGLANGVFEPESAGAYTVTATSVLTGLSATRNVVVTGLPLAEIRRNLNNAPVVRMSSRDKLPLVSTLPTSTSIPITSLLADDLVTESKRKRGATAEEGEPANSLPLPDDGGWNERNGNSGDDPGNQTGDAPGMLMDDGAGNGNFQISAPVVSLSGRGVDLGLNLHYNSRLWNKAVNGSSTELTYDIDKGFPAPGWSLGFGKMISYGRDGGCLIEDADGTRHGFGGRMPQPTSGQGGSYVKNFYGRTSDGTFIDYNCFVSKHPNGSFFGHATAQLANGTIVQYGAIINSGEQMYPIQIIDVEGNYIDIHYRADQNGVEHGPQIDFVYDTMGRTLQFRYDANNRLTSVKAPEFGTNGSGTGRELLRLHYKPISLAGPTGAVFAPSINRMVREENPNVLDALYYPATRTGYWFGDPDSYSRYGMLAKVVEQRAMTFAPEAGNADGQGTVNSGGAGVMTKQAVYNYPAATGSGYGDAPTYDKLTEMWAGMTNPNDPAVTLFSINNNDYHNDGASNSPSRTITITQPDGIISKQYSYRTPNEWTDGLVFADETIATIDSTQKIVSSSLAGWQEGDYDSPRPFRTTKTDENGNQTSTEFAYGQLNQVTRSCDYGFDNQRLRCTNVIYENSQNYIGSRLTYGTGNNTYQVYQGRHIFNLVKSEQVLQGDDNASVTVSRAEYEYDNGFNGSPAFEDARLKATPNVVMHNPTYDPNSTGREICDPYIGCFTVDGYDPKTTFRGHVTKTTVFAEAQTPSGAIDNTKGYDVTGNVVTASASCCELRTLDYTIDTQFAYPTSQIRGASDLSSPLKETMSAAYDLSTGLVTQTTDPNGLTARTQYDATSLRSVKSTSSTNAYTLLSYNDDEMSIGQQIYQAPEVGNTNGVSAGTTMSYLNGLGKSVRVEMPSSSGAVDKSQTKYDKLGRAVMESRPYREGDSLRWTTTAYDEQGRVKTVTAPDGSTSFAFYNEGETTRPSSAQSRKGSTVRSQDAWGRERWARYDERNRLVEVVEPNPDGDGKVTSAGNISTVYNYDTFGRLIETVQGVQCRKFKYDDLGRLTRQKLAEQTATINDAGVYVGAGQPGAVWSEAFAYDYRSNVTARTDARGVITNYSYLIGTAEDPLNRLQSVSYNLSRPQDPDQPVANAWTVVNEYETSGDRSRLRKVSAQGISTEDYTYDAQSRVKDVTYTISARSIYPQVTSYKYDTLSRVTEVEYPRQYGLTVGSSPRKIVKQEFDGAGNLTTLKYKDQLQVSGIAIDAAGQTIAMNVGEGTNQMRENYEFDPQTGLLTNQKVTKTSSGERVMDLSYNYLRQSGTGGVTGAVTAMTDNLERNRDRKYNYDALGRLTRAVGGVNETWTQRYSYDRYGNRFSVTATGVETFRSTEREPKGKSRAGAGKTSEGNVTNSVSGKTQSEPTIITASRPAVDATRATSAGELVGSVNSLIPSDSIAFGIRDKDSFNNGSDTTNGKTSGPSADDSSYENKDNFSNGGNGATSETTSKPSDEAKAESAPETAPAAAKNAATLKPTKTKNKATATMPPASQTAFDFDGDGKTDKVSWNKATAVWKIKSSINGAVTSSTLGTAGNQIAPADYDGDGKTDQAVWNPANGVWTVKQSSTGGVYTQQWGAKGDAIVPADYDGDGRADLAVWRPTSGEWYILKSSNGSYTVTAFGNGKFGDIPAVGDYDGDRKADITVWRPEITATTAKFFLLKSSTGQVGETQWGQAGDVPVPSDYDGDGKTDFAVWRPSQTAGTAGTWYVIKSADYGFLSASLGVESAGDVMVPGDYDGDGKADPAVWRASNGTWYVLNVSNGAISQVQEGGAGEIPAPTAYIRRSSAPQKQSSGQVTDGLANVTYDNATNRITSPGWEYDAAGNQTRALAEGGQNWQRFEYDAANRLINVRTDGGALLQSFAYGVGNERILTNEVNGDGSTTAVYYAGGSGGQVLCEYTETNGSGVMTWRKSSVYFGGSLLVTITPDASNTTSGEAFEYHHPDRTGTRLVSSAKDGTSYTQTSMPFGTAIGSESSNTAAAQANAKKFTSYDRSKVTGLDYAVNRTYDSKQGRFTQVDPIGMSASSLTAPQTLNLYSYCGNDPINRTDPSGLFFGKLFRFLSKALKWIGIAVVVATIVISVATFIGIPGASIAAKILGVILAKVGAAVHFLSGGLLAAEGGAAAVLLGLRTISILGGIGAVAEHFTGKPPGKKVCPPKSGNDTFFGKGINLNDYLSTLLLSEKNGREEGGWIYQNEKTGELMAIRKNRDLQVDPGEKRSNIQLGYPRQIKGWRVVGTFHTHEGGFSNPSSSNGADEDINNLEHKVPGMILSRRGKVYKSNGSKKIPTRDVNTPIVPEFEDKSVFDPNFVIYGPGRGVFRVGIPKGC